MKLPDLPALALEVPRLGLASFRRRILIRAVFLLLALATLAFALVLLQDEKERSLRNYQQNFRKTQADVMARLRQPAGQLALLNPYPASEVTPVRLLLLPYPALDFEDPGKALQAVDQAGCSTIYPDDSALCAGVGSNAYAGSFLYLVGSFASGELVGRGQPGALDLADVHYARIRLEMRGEVRSWVAPFELQSMRGEPLVRGRFVAYPAPDDTLLPADTPPLRDFRGWVWQGAACAGGGEPPACARRVSYAIRMPVEAFRAALGSARNARPPARMPSSSFPRRSDTSSCTMPASPAGSCCTRCDTAAARRVSTAMRRSMPSSMTSQASTIAPSIAPTYHDMRVATTPRPRATPCASPLMRTS